MRLLGNLNLLSMVAVMVCVIAPCAHVQAEKTSKLLTLQVSRTFCEYSYCDGHAETVSSLALLGAERLRQSCKECRKALKKISSSCRKLLKKQAELKEDDQQKRKRARVPKPLVCSVNGQPQLEPSVEFVHYMSLLLSKTRPSKTTKAHATSFLTLVALGAASKSQVVRAYFRTLDALWGQPLSAHVKAVIEDG